jgi:hypothetical protein
MLTQLTTVKTRLQLADTTFDDVVTAAIAAFSERFDRECNRKFARQVNAIEEFAASHLDICPACWPIETITSFDVKSNDADGWQPVSPTPTSLTRNSCVIALNTALGSRDQQARVTYTGGYVLPGTTPAAGQTPLPADIEQACIDQVAYWFLNRTTPGLISVTVTNGSHIQTVDLLPSVVAVLQKHQRMTL